MTTHSSMTKPPKPPDVERNVKVPIQQELWDSEFFVSSTTKMTQQKNQSQVSGGITQLFYLGRFGPLAFGCYLIWYTIEGSFGPQVFGCN